MEATAAQIIFSVLTIVAIVVAPFLAVQASEKLSERKEARNRKMQVFSDLMATRASILSPKHVEALNRIDIEFYGIDDVTESWKEYNDHLAQASRIESDNKEKWENWTTKREDLIVNLLSKMAVYLGYKFDNVHIKRGHYYPKAYVDTETELMIIRKGLVRYFYE